jgi:hypothetical protein
MLYKFGNDNVMITPEGGIAIKVINRTGETSIKGKLINTEGDIDNSVALVAIDEPDCVGVIYTADVPVNGEMWVVVAGKAQVLFSTATTRGQFARAPAGSDVSKTDGYAIAEPVPAPPLSTNKHFQEIGHLLETIASPGLATCVLHFN